MKKHPNATAGTISGAGGGPLLVWILSLFGLDVDVYVAAALAGLVSGMVLLVGRKGLKGVAGIVWHGAS